MSNQNEQESLLAPLLLLASALIGFAVANSPLSELYFSALEAKLAFVLGGSRFFDKTILHVINDGLMVIFFLFIGLELKREIVVGELSDMKKAMLPVVSAIGGMVAPALIFASFNIGGDGAHGWGIPMATDIAFALGVLTVLGSRVPSSLKVMLAAIAIVDDLGAICVIAIFYTAKIDTQMLAYAASFFACCLIMNRMGVMKLSLYLLLGLPMWYCTLKSGIHATISGVLLAATIPLAPRNKSTAKLISDIFSEKASALDSPAVFLEKSLYKWIGLVIIPIFALANAGVSLQTIGFGKISLGVIFGLSLGKPLGIVGFSYISKKFGLVSLPKGLSWSHLLGLGLLAGIGFTMSLFVASLAYSSEALLNEAKFAVICGSILSGTLGAGLLVSLAKKSPSI